MYVIFQLLCCIRPQDHTVLDTPSVWVSREVDDMEMSEWPLWLVKMGFQYDDNLVWIIIALMVE